MSKFTIGMPREYGTHNANIIFKAGTEESVAMVYGLPMHSTLEEIQGNPRFAEGLAMARLLAAAPELLAVLERIIGDLAHVDELPAVLSELDIEQARSVIAKAKGVQL